MPKRIVRFRKLYKFFGYRLGQFFYLFLIGFYTIT